ncbi:Fe2OG dioxygenase domain-containing protein [Psidium guajava]|nr:Fe2OG dioxygenase domain-containing protein [Psidium guajava]
MGFEHVDLPYCGRRGITVTSASTTFCEDEADHALAMLIDVMRRVSHGNQSVRAGPEKVALGISRSVSLSPLIIWYMLGWMSSSYFLGICKVIGLNFSFSDSSCALSITLHKCESL